MAKQSVVTLLVTIQGDGINTSYTPPGAPVINANAPAGGPVTVTLAAGDNTLVVPPNTRGVIIVPPAASTVVKKLKGAAPDVGLTISPSLLTGPIGLTAGTTTLLLNAASGEDITVQWL